MRAERLEAGEIVARVEAAGVEFVVEGGEVRIFFDEEREDLRRIAGGLLRRRRIVRQFLVKQRGASAQVLLELWKADALLREEFNGELMAFVEEGEAGVEFLFQSLETRRGRSRS